MEINAVHEENNLLNGDKCFLSHYLPEVDSGDSDLQKSLHSEKTAGQFMKDLLLQVV